jgi:acyl carrier protein
MDTPMTRDEMVARAELRNDISTQLKNLLVERLDLPIEPSWITDDQPLFGRGLELDSVDALELAVGLDDFGEVEVTDDLVGFFGSINRVVDFVEANQGVLESALEA